MRRLIATLLVCAITITTSVPQMAQGADSPGALFLEHLEDIEKLSPESRQIVQSAIFRPEADFFEFLEFPRSPTHQDLGISKRPESKDPVVQAEYDKKFEAAYQVKLKEKYQEMLRKYQKSKHPKAYEAAIRAIRKRLKTAYDVLSNPGRRWDYIGGLQKKEYLAKRLSLLPPERQSGPGVMGHLKARAPGMVTGNLGFMLGMASYMMLKAHMSKDRAMLWAAWDTLHDLEGMVSLAGFSVASDIGAMTLQAGGKATGAALEKAGYWAGPKFIKTAGHVRRFIDVGPQAASMFGMAVGSFADHFIQKFLMALDQHPEAKYYHREHGDVARRRAEVKNEIVSIAGELRDPSNQSPERQSELNKRYELLRDEHARLEERCKAYRSEKWKSIWAIISQTTSLEGEIEQLLVHGSQMLFTSYILHKAEASVGRALTGAEQAIAQQEVLHQISKLPKSERPINAIIRSTAKKSFLNVSNWRVFTAIGEMNATATGQLLTQLSKSALNAIAFLWTMEKVGEFTNPLIQTELLLYRLTASDQELYKTVREFISAPKDRADLYEKIEAQLEARANLWLLFRETIIKGKVNEHVAAWDKEMTDLDKRYNKMMHMLPWLARGGSMKDPDFCKNGGVVDSYCRTMGEDDANPMANMFGFPWHIDSKFPKSLSDEVSEFRRQYNYILGPYIECVGQNPGRADLCTDPRKRIVSLLAEENKQYLIQQHTSTQERRLALQDLVNDAYSNAQTPGRVRALVATGDAIEVINKKYNPISGASEFALGMAGIPVTVPSAEWKRQKFVPSFNVLSSYADEVESLTFLLKNALTGVAQAEIGADVLKSLDLFKRKDWSRIQGALTAFNTPPIRVAWAEDKPENKIPQYTKNQKADLAIMAFGKAIFSVIQRYHAVPHEILALVTFDQPAGNNELSNPFNPSQTDLLLSGRDLKNPEQLTGNDERKDDADMDAIEAILFGGKAPVPPVAQPPSSQPTTKATQEEQDPAAEEAAAQAELQRRIEHETKRKDEAQPVSQTHKVLGVIGGVVGLQLAGPLLAKITATGTLIGSAAMMPAAAMHSAMLPELKRIDRANEEYLDRLWDGYLRDPDLIQRAPGILKEATDIINRECAKRSITKWGGCIQPGSVFLSPLAFNRVSLIDDKPVWEVKADSLLNADAAKRIARDLAELIWFELGPERQRRFRPAFEKQMTERIVAVSGKRPDKPFKEEDFAREFAWDMLGRPGPSLEMPFEKKVRIYLRDLQKRLNATDGLGRLNAQQLSSEKFYYRVFKMERLQDLKGGKLEIPKQCGNIKHEQKLAELRLLHYTPRCESVNYGTLLGTELLTDLFRKSGDYTSVIDKAHSASKEMRAFVIASAISRFFGAKSPGARVRLFLLSGVVIYVGDRILSLVVPDEKISAVMTKPWEAERAQIRDLAYLINTAQVDVIDGGLDTEEFNKQLIEKLRKRPDLVKFVRLEAE